MKGNLELFIVEKLQIEVLGYLYIFPMLYFDEEDGIQSDDLFLGNLFQMNHFVIFLFLLKD
jgi:hypothetical protein